MKSLSERFHSMDEIRTSVESMKNTLSPEDYELMLYLFGLLENRGVYDSILLHGQELKIDRSITPMIVDLNSRDITTLASCSGLQSEHPEGRFRPESGYLAISFDARLLSFLQNNLQDSLIDISKGESYLKEAIIIVIRSKEDTVLKEKWSLIWEILKRWKDD